MPTTRIAGLRITGTVTPTKRSVSSLALATMGSEITMPVSTPIAEPTAPNSPASLRNPVMIDAGEAPNAEAIAISRRRSSTESRVIWVIRMTPTPIEIRAKIPSRGSSTSLTL